jgi:hypothetical protein
MEEEQLQILIDQLLMNANEFSKTIGVSVDTVYHILKKRNKMSASVKRKILETYPNLNKEWFETGKGEMYTWKEPTEKKSEIAEDPSKYSGNLIQQMKDKDFIIQEQQRIIVQQRELIDSILNK